MIDQHLPILVPLTLLLGALLVPSAGFTRRRLAHPITLSAVTVSLVFAGYGLHRTAAYGTVRYHLAGWVPPVGIEYVLDVFAGFMLSVILVIALFVLVHARPTVENELREKQVPFYSVSLLLLAGFTGIILTGDLFNLFVFLEISSLAGYALISVGENRSPVAAFRYLLIGSVGASFYLLGLGFLYMLTGSLNMGDLAKILPTLYGEPTVTVGLVLIVIGIGIKMALFPMHGWLPDAYTYAPSTGSALLAPLGTKVAAYILIRFLFFVMEPSFVRDQLPVMELIAWLSAAGIVFGSVMAIAQTELKRMLAYSSVAQIAYIGLGIGMASTLGLIGAILHVLNHALMKACLFLVAGNLRAQVGHSSIPRFDEPLRTMMPWTMASFTIGALSMIGIPPTAGFFSKWYLVLAGIGDSRWIFVVIIMLSSLLSIVYFFRILERVYMRSEKKNKSTQHYPSAVKANEGSPLMVVPTVVLAISLIVVGLVNVFFVETIIRPMLPPGL